MHVFLYRTVTNTSFDFSSYFNGLEDSSDIFDFTYIDGVKRKLKLDILIIVISMVIRIDQ